MTPRRPVRLFVIARHAESCANVAGVVSSDPARAVPLTARGRAQARRLGGQLANLDIDLAVCTRLQRIRQTLEVALAGRAVPVLVEPGFDEIRAGDFDGKPIEDYWSWREHHTENERLPHGESEDDGLFRYGNAVRRLLSRSELVTVLVVHEFALHHIAAAATSGPSPWSEQPFANALPFLFDERALERAAAALEKHHSCVRRAVRRPDGAFAEMTDPRNVRSTGRTDAVELPRKKEHPCQA